MFNPFFYGNPVPPSQFINRRRELHRIIGRIVNQGQSTAIVGEPRSGKTSLLHYLAAPETRAELYSEHGERLLFTYLDAQTLGGEFSQAQFWKYALHPLYEEVIAPTLDSPLSQAYKTCQDNDFGAFVLERLFSQMQQGGWRLVLMLDEFDVLLYHPILNSAEFFGSLRGLASRSRGALALVTGSRQSLTRLNEVTQQFSHTGSPYFNFLSEVTLGPWPNRAVTELLGRAGDRFTPNDRRFITEVAGEHPYSLQVAASMMWEAYAEGENDPTQRWQQVGQSLYEETALTLGDTWRLWHPATRRAFTAVALAQIPALLDQREFYVERLLHDVRDFGPELRSLAKQGFVFEDKAFPGGWRVRSAVFLWWLSDELVRVVRDDPSLKEWVQKQEWEGLLTHDEKEQLGKTVSTITRVLREGVSELITAAAKGIVGQ